MRICLISREYPPDTGWGGIGAYTFNTARALHSAGHEVEVIALKKCSKESGDPSQNRSIDNGITVHRVDWENVLEELNLFLISAPSCHYVLGSGIAIWKKFIELHRKKRFDIVEAPEHLGAGIFHALTGASPLVLTLHTPHSKFVAENFHSVEASFDNQAICLLERLAINQADLLLSPSMDLGKFVASDTGISIKDIEILRNPVDTDLFCPEGRFALSATENVRVLFVGRLEERKGIHILIESIPKILKQFKQVEFCIVGNDTNTAPDGESMRGYLQQCLAQNGSLDRVEFISHVPLEQMPEYYRSADICVIPSLYDNAPYTCIEALASGKPVIVSSFGGTKEYVEEGVTGFVVPGENPNLLAEAILTLLQDEKRRQEMAMAARNYAVQFLDLKTYCRRKIELYETAISAHQDKTSRNLYQLPLGSSLEDTVELLCAFDQMVYKTLYEQSCEFRFRHRYRLLRSRPKLALTQAAHFVLDKMPNISLLGLDGLKSKVLSYLDRAIEGKSTPPYSLARTWGKLSADNESANTARLANLK